MAQERVAVLGFAGPHAGSARAAVMRAVEQEYELVDLREWQQAARRVGARGTSPRALAAVAAELGVKAIVTGGVRRVRRRFTLSIVVRDGADGSVVGREGRAMPSVARAGATGAALASRVLATIAEARGAEPGGARRRPEPEEYEEPDYYDDLEAERPPMFGDDEEEPAEVAQAEDEETAHERGSERDRGDRGGEGSGETTPHGWLEFGIEINGASRSFSVPISESIDNSNRDEARFESAVYPEFGARLSFYPGGVFTDNWAAGIGIEGSFHHHLYLKVLNRRRSEEVESEQYAFTVGATYRVVLGNADRGLTLWPRIGFGRFSFFLGDRGNDIVPPFVYDHIYIGINAYIPLATRYIGIEVGADYLAVLRIGSHATQAYNESGALPTTHGFQIQVGLSGQIVAGLRWRLAFEMLGFISHHQGVGQGWGIDPTTRIDTATGQGIQTTGAATDIFFRLIPHLSYRFGWRPESSGGDGGGDRGTDSGGSRGGSWYDDTGSNRDREDDEGGGGDEWDDEEW